MKKNYLLIILLFCAFSINAQWVQVTNGLPDYAPTTLCSFVDTMFLSTYGGGIYKTDDKGESWIDISGTLSNLYVNDIRFSGNQYIIYVSTEGGPFLYYNDALGNFAYADCNGTGLTNTEVTFWHGGTGGITGEGVAGTRGGGFFAAEYTSPFTYDWAPANTGLTGDALFINDMVVGDNLAVLATDGGFYKAIDDETEWTAKNIGLTGEALKINDINWYGLLGIFIATDGGLYYSLDAESWTVLVPDEKFNVVLCLNTDFSTTGFMIFALGETGYYSEDLEIWNQMDFGGIEGEVTAAIADEENVYIGFTTTKKSTKGSGGIYRKPLEQFLVGIEDEEIIGLSRFNLSQNYPNPFSQSTNISYSLKKSDFVSLKVYDFAGREIKTLINKFQEKGLYSVVFEGENLPDGIYTYKLQIGNDLYKTKKMMLIK